MSENLITENVIYQGNKGKITFVKGTYGYFATFLANSQDELGTVYATFGNGFDTQSAARNSAIKAGVQFK